MRPHSSSLPILAVLACPLGATADPVSSPAACEVTIARAPDDIRAAIERWIAAEPRCVTSLEVRVVPTDGGYYLLARDGAGRTRERIVPDGETAGVLVASWVADDVIAAAAPPPAAPSPVTTLPAAPTALTIPAAQATPAPASRRWLALATGADLAHMEGIGLRGEVDVLARGRWAVGIVGAVETSRDVLARADAFGTVDVDDLRALVAGSWTLPVSPRWAARLGVGVGFVWMTARAWIDEMEVDARGVFPTAEVSVQLALGLGARWSLTGGPVVTWYAQSYQAADGTNLADREAFVMTYLGLRRRL